VDLHHKISWKSVFIPVWRAMEDLRETAHVDLVPDAAQISFYVCWTPCRLAKQGTLCWNASDDPVRWTDSHTA
jgi:hypothetical protein